MPDLQSTLRDLAENFAAALMDTLRATPLNELHAAGGEGNVGNGRTRARSAHATVLERPIRNRASGRLQRRSAEDIAKLLEQVTAVVRRSTEGLRAEQIREALGLQAKEMPRILKEGISKKALKSKGHKRATTYFAR